ncbi:Mlr5527 protein [Olavius sp. associated proteobacterium Delta 1]|nr:Mlr5527 protein [Olavius sp. associated proteobacterium Delta 1]
MKKNQNTRIGKTPATLNTIGAAAILLIFAIQAGADDLDVSAAVHQPQLEHILQQELNQLVVIDPHQAFEEAFEVGDKLFGTAGNELDGIGAYVGNGSRFAKHPRVDLTGPMQWANHIPERVTGPNSQACSECHFHPSEDGSGPVSTNNVRDPKRKGKIGKFITRQPPHVFGIGAKQRLAEEMTQELHQIRDAALVIAQTRNQAKAKLIAKGIRFGRITAYPDGSLDFSEVEGVDDDLIIKPLQWKGANSTVRDFVREAENNELGLQAVEIVGIGQDGDFDQIVNELTVGDITALAIYQAAQPRPVTKTELADLGLMALSSEEEEQIEAGGKVFKKIKCLRCHVPELQLDSPIFSEPSRSAAYRDQSFPSGDNPRELGLRPRTAVTFDLTQDMPDNIIELETGRIFHLGNFKKNESGQTIVNIFSDLKRHDLGERVAEPVDEIGTGPSVFITQPLWGAGSTAPYMHDGRSPTITDAILQHGGEAANSRDKFVNLKEKKKKALVAYIENQILFKQTEE